MREEKAVTMNARSQYSELQIMYGAVLDLRSDPEDLSSFVRARRFLGFRKKEKKKKELTKLAHINSR